MLTRPQILIVEDEPGIDHSRAPRPPWGHATDSLDRTVDAHVKTLRAKFKAVAPTLEAIRMHRGTGYALADDLPDALP